MERRNEKDVQVTGMLMLGAIMGGQSIDDAVNELGRSAQCQAISRRDFARERYGHPLIWRTLGFVFHEEEEGNRPDRQLQPTTFPEGWKVEPTSHYIHNNIVDQHGRERGSFMYKPDIWDRDASASLKCRYVIHRDYNYTEDGEFDGSKQRYIVADQGKTDRDPERVLAHTDWIETPSSVNYDKEKWAVIEKQEEEAKASLEPWFAENAPLLRDLKAAKAKAIEMIKKAVPEVTQKEIDEIPNSDFFLLLYWD